MGLPYRFGVATEVTFERFNGGGGASTASIEGRYALADWNKIPLNPTLFVEYKFGVGTSVTKKDRPPPPGEEEESGPPQHPDAYEIRLLLAQDFGEKVEWAFNAFFEKENTGDRGREWGFAQSATTPILLPNERLKVGVEMQYINFTVKDIRDGIRCIGLLSDQLLPSSQLPTRASMYHPCSAALTTRPASKSLLFSPGSSGLVANRGPKHPSRRAIAKFKTTEETYHEEIYPDPDHLLRLWWTCLFRNRVFRQSNETGCASRLVRNGMATMNGT